MTDPIRVLVADDHALFRKAMQAVLTPDDGFELVGEAADGEQAVKLAVETVPDVVLMDIRMPRLGGIEATSQIAEQLPSSRIVMLSASDEDEDVFEAIKAGASGYLLKEAEPDAVADAVRQVAQGHTLLSPTVATKVVAEFQSMARKKEERGPRLTEREIEVLAKVAEGLTNQQVGRQLHISPNTVKNHIRNILEKLHLNTRMEAVLYALREELIDLDDTE